MLGEEELEDWHAERKTDEVKYPHFQLLVEDI